MALITPLKGSEGADPMAKGTPRTIDEGPPAATSKPKPAAPKGSLFQQASNTISTQNAAGLGAEGGNPQVVANQALSQVLTGIRTLSVVLPGLVPILSDLTGRLQMIVPQMMADMTNGGSGLVPSMGMQPPQPGMGGGMMAGQGQQPGMAPPGAPPMGGLPGMGAPPPPGMPMG